MVMTENDDEAGFIVLQFFVRRSIAMPEHSLNFENHVLMPFLLRLSRI